MTNKAMMTAALAILLTAAACRKNDMNGPNLPPETIVFTIDKAPERLLKITLVVGDANKADVWADLNDNGKMDEGEAVAKWDWKQGFPGEGSYTKSGVQPGSSKITIHGWVRELSCWYGNDLGSHITSMSANSSTLKLLTIVRSSKLTKLDTRKLPALMVLYCSRNRLTSLDLSNNKRLRSINCELNAIKGAGMDRLVNSLPDMSENGANINIIAPGKAEEKNVCSKAQVKVATGKGWRVYEYYYVPYPGS